MTRQNILLIAGAAALAVGVLLVALLLGANQKQEDPEKTAKPVPATTLDPGPSPTAPTETEPPAGHSEEEDPHAGHSHGEEPEDCDTGPVSCEDDEEAIRYGEGDQEAAEAVRARVAPFVQAWTTVNSTETPAARVARLISAGASPEAAAGVSTLARADTVQIGLTASTAPRAVQRSMFMGREDGLLKFKASLDVDATYMQPGDSGSRHVAGGSVYVYLDDNGTIAKVTDTFPTIESLR